MRRLGIGKKVAALLGGLLIVVGISGCGGAPLATPAPTTVATTPPTAPTVAGTATLSPTLAYMNSTRFTITLYSTSFNVADTVKPAQPYDSGGNPLTQWTIYQQKQDLTGMTITVVFNTGNGMPMPPPDSKTPAPAPAAPSVTATVNITTTNGVTITVPVKPVSINPCGT